MLTELATRIRGRLKEYEQGVQLPLLEDPIEQAQFEQDVASLRRRLDEIPAEVELEVAAIERRYANPMPRVFPASVSILIPAGYGPR